MAEINLIDDFYLPLRKEEEVYSSKEYKLLKENNVDTAQLLNLEPDVNAGVIELGKEEPNQKEDLTGEVLDFVKSMPADFLTSVLRGSVNGFDFIKDIAAAASYGTRQIPEDSVFQTIDNELERFKQNLDAQDKDSPLVSKIIATAGQDAAYVYPIYRKFKSIGIPKQFALPISFALGSTFAFDKSTSFMLDTETIRDFKRAIDIDANSPAEEVFDKLVQFVEFSGMGFAFNKIAPIFKEMRKINPKKAAIVLGGSAAAGAGFDAITSEAEGAVPPKVIKTLAEEGIKKLKSVTSTKSNELFDQIIKGKQDIKVLDVWKPNTPDKIKNEFYSIQGLDKMTIDQNTRGADIINKYLKEDRSNKFVDYVEKNYSDQDFNKIMKKFGFDDEVLPID